MRIARNVVIGLAVGLAVGCRSSAAGSAATGGSGAEAMGGGAAAAGGGGAPVKQEIVDPSFNNMNAVEVTIPAGWHFQGMLMQGGNCVPTPFPVFRVTSQDGLSVMERVPTIGWRFGTGPLAAQGQSDCLALKSAIGAQAFLKYLAPTMNLSYVSDVPEPAAENEAAQSGLAAAEAVYAPKYAASHMTPPKQTRELARARVNFQNGTFAMEGEMRVTVDCIQSTYPGMKSILQGMPSRPDSVVTQCTAGTRFYSAPSGKLTPMLVLWDAPGMGAVGRQDWQQAWVNRNQQQANAAIAKSIANTNAAMAASRQMFQQSMAVQNQMHQQFLATMQRGTDMSMANANASMNARSTAASDWVDYALDKQTVLNPSTGEVSKVSNAYSYTWVDSTGKTSYQTSDVNANPNGVLQGTWTKQQVVHGNGTQ
ncbi:MAG: hypothetical protein M3O31_02900 [Acidobacteriota bacterium]|nr:hypothetical protein [Acidobacteriota bacterium]